MCRLLLLQASKDKNEEARSLEKSPAAPGYQTYTRDYVKERLGPAGALVYCLG